MHLRVIDSVTRHSCNLTLILQGLDNLDLVLRRCTSEYIVFFHGNPELFITHGIQFRTGNALRVLLVEQTLHDPEGRFANEFTDRLFGPV